MQRDVTLKVMMVTFLAVLSACCLVPMMSETDADIVYEKEITCYYYSVGMAWSGEGAETVTWDFGDGSDPVTGFNVTHRYAEIGNYTVTLTGTNPLGSDVKYYLIHIMGYPVISFESNGGSDVASIQMPSGGNGSVAATQPEDPVRDGFTFAGWYTDAELTQAYDWSKLVTKSITLYAKWIDSSAPTVTISFDVDGGSEVLSPVTVSSGSFYVLPYYSGVREGYDFSGWNVSGTVIPEGTAISVFVDTHVVAVWSIRTYTVSFDNGLPSQMVEHGSKATMPEAPSKVGYDFVQWTLDGDAYDFDIPVTQDIHLMAQWQIRIYTVSFDSGVASQTVNHGDRAGLPNTPVKEGYTFVMWTLNGSAYDFDTPVTSDIHLVAEWQRDSDPVDPPTYTYHRVTFDTDGGSEISHQSVREGSKATKPVDPVKGGFRFVGWFLGDSEYDFDIPVTGPITLIAHWGPVPVLHTVTFDTDGGSVIGSQMVEDGMVVTSPELPVKDGYTFSGWYLGDEAYDFTTPVTSDITLMAHWTEKVPEGPGDEPGTGEPDDGKKDDPMKAIALVAVAGLSILGLLVFIIIRL